MRLLSQITRLFLFPLFALRLGFQIGGFLLVLGLVSALPFFASFLILIAVCAYLFLLFYPKQNLATGVPPAPPFLPLPLPAELAINQAAQLKIQNVSEKLNFQKNQWQEYLTLQPTHRDLLINLGLIEYYSENQAGYQKFINQAQRVDPNHEMFVQNR